MLRLEVFSGVVVRHNGACGALLESNSILDLFLLKLDAEQISQLATYTTISGLMIASGYPTYSSLEIVVRGLTTFFFLRGPSSSHPN